MIVCGLGHRRRDVSLQPADTVRALIFGCSGPILTAEERSFFRSAEPFGFILFQRNCVDPSQVAALTAALRDSVGRADAPILIDQEGGRVARLKAPHWRHPPPARRFAELYRQNPRAGLEAARLNASVIGHDLLELGIDVDCAPVLDLPVKGAHDVIGDRAYGDQAAQVAALGRAVCEGLLSAGVLPVIKHIPGHGRATADSHLELPVVDTAEAQLIASDFIPFSALADQPWAMTAHVRYSTLDPDECATTSRKVISEVIRGRIGFDGLLLSDDLGMKALGGSFKDRAARVLAAGCDIALHCSGDLKEMRAVVEGTGVLTEVARRRIRRGRTIVEQARETMDRAQSLAQLDSLLAQDAAA